MWRGCVISTYLNLYIKRHNHNQAENEKRNERIKYK